MNRTRASSLETNKTCKTKYETYPSIFNQSNAGRNIVQSILCNKRDLGEDSHSLDYYLGQGSKRIPNVDAFDDIGSSCPSVNISEALKHEYHQMMTALKDLENILVLKKSNTDTLNFSTNSGANDTQVPQLQREIYYRDSLIKCLSDRLKVLCQANDKLIIDYENQENILSEELLCLKRQLEKAKDAMRSLSLIKNRPIASNSQETDSELYYLRESLCTKEMMIADLKHRIERLNMEISNLKCELDRNEGSVSRCVSSQFERDISYVKHINEQMKGQIDALTHSLDLKNHLIIDLQNRLENNEEGNSIRNLREQLIIINEENELHKDEILEQTEMLEDLRNQLDILSENTQFKDETIVELKSCLRKLTNSITGESVRGDRGSQMGSGQGVSGNKDLIRLLDTVKKHVQHHNPDFLRLIGSDHDIYKVLEQFFEEILKLATKSSLSSNDIELFKEFLTNEINLKNKIGQFLINNTTGTIDSVEKLQNQMNLLLSIDMDDGFNDDLREYLHQCLLLDDNLRVVIEYLVKCINNIPVKSTTISTSIQEMDLKPVKSSKNEEKLKSVEEELRKISMTYQNDKNRFVKELSDKEHEIGSCNRKLKELEKLINGKLSKEDSYKMLLDENSRLMTDSVDYRDKLKDLEIENERLKIDNQTMISKMKQMERDLSLQAAELDTLEKSMKKLSNKFVNFSSASDEVKLTIDSFKDTEIKKLSKELESLREVQKSRDDLEKLYIEQTRRLSLLSKDMGTLKIVESHNSDLQQVISRLKNKIEEQAMEKNNLLEEKNNEIRELMSKFTQERKNSIGIQSLHSDKNQDLLMDIQRLKEENQQLSEKLASCLEEKFKLDSKLNEIKFQTSDQENSKAVRFQSDLYSLKLENKSLEMKTNSIETEKTFLDGQVKQLKSQLDDIKKKCSENHVDKTVLKRDSEETDICKQKVVDLESILAVMTEELNEKVESLEEIRKMIRNQPLFETNIDYKLEKIDQSGIHQQLLSQKESEISYLKSKLDNANVRKSVEIAQIKSLTMETVPTPNIEISRLNRTICELENRIDRLNEQLTDRSNDIAHLQHLVKEKDNIIDNANKTIRTKNDSLQETEKLMHLLSLQNTNIKDELSISYDKSIELKMLKLSDENLKEEIQRVKVENDHLRVSLRSSLKIDSAKKSKSQSFDLLPQIAPSVNIHEKSVLEINQEIKKLYVNFEDKNKELKEYSLNEINSRDKKLESVNLELKLKTDQIQKIIIENRRLSDIIEDESQKSSKYEYNLLLKEQLLQKLMKEKEKIRATFITELQDKNEELTERSNTVYFLNAELHRLSSDLEILNAELYTVKSSEKYYVTQTRTLEIAQTELCQVKEENSSLKFCVNLKMAENEAMRSELTIQQVGNNQLLSEVNVLKSGLSDRELRLNKTLNESDSIKKTLSNVQSETQRTIDNLKGQLDQIREDFKNISELKGKLEKANHDLSKENVSLKHVKEELENEKLSYRNEIDNLRKKIDSLTNNLSESQGYIAKVSGNVEIEQQKGRRLSEAIEMSEKTKMIKANELDKALQELEAMKIENLEYRNQMEKLQNIIANLEGRVKHNDLENQFDECLKRKSVDYEELRNEHDRLLEMVETYRQQVFSFETKENLDMQRLQCDYNSLQCYNIEISSQIETLTEELVSANTQVWNATSTINEDQLTINELCARLNDKLTSYRRYGSQPLLNNIDSINPDFRCFQQRNYNDLKARYNLLCSQIDSLGCQMKKKDIRIHDLENENQTFNFNSLNFERLKCDYHNLELKYKRLESEYSNISQQYRSKNKEHLKIQGHEVETIQACTNELQDTILTQNKELDQLKSSHEMLANDYNGCCDRLRQLESQIALATMELGNWETTYYNKTENLNHMQTEVKKLRQQNENLLLEMDENNHFKQELIDMNSRMIEVMNCNMNLEQQSTNYRKKVTQQNKIIEDLKTQLNTLESYYEHEVDICRKDVLVLKDNNKSYSTEINNEINQKNNIIDCLNEELKSAQAEIGTFHDQYKLQCERFNNLKQELDQQLLIKEELQQEYQEQGLNIEQLSAQLFDNRNLIERLTSENYRMVSVGEENQCRINILLEKLEKSNEYINEKDNEVKKNQRSVEMLEDKLSATEQERRNLLNQVVDFTDQLDNISPNNLTDINQLKNELTSCYDIIDRLKMELTKMSSEREKIDNEMCEKDQLLIMKDEDCGKRLESSGREIERLRREIEHRVSTSSKELNQLKDASYLKNKVYRSYHSVETQTSMENHFTGISSPSPMSDYLMTDNRQFDIFNEKNDVSHVSEPTYSSSKSVTWKTTHTDKVDYPEEGVLALQQAIHDYNTIITDITVTNNVEETSNETHSSARDWKASPVTETSPQMTAFNELSRTRELEKNVNEVIFVEVEEPAGENAALESNANLIKSMNVMELLRNCHVNLIYDENKETPDAYFGRVMDRYKELEQFFVASVKIQFNQQLEGETVDLFENFTENVEKNRKILNEHCQQLTNMIMLNTTEIKKDGVGETVRGFTTENVMNLIELVKTQQKQMSALNTVFINLEEITPFSDNIAVDSSFFHLSAPYELALQTQNMCMVDIQSGRVAVKKKPTKSQSAESGLLGSTLLNVQHDSSLEHVSNKKLIGSSIERPYVNKVTEISKSPPVDYQIAETKGLNIKEESTLNLLTKDTPIKVINSLESIQSHPSGHHGIESPMNDIKDDSYFQRDTIDISMKLNDTKESQKGKNLARSENKELQVNESKLKNSYEEFGEHDQIKGRTDSSTKVTIQDQGLLDIVITVESIQYNETGKGVESSVDGIEIIDKFTGLNNGPDTIKMVTSADSVKINIAMEDNMSDINETTEVDLTVQSEQQSAFSVSKKADVYDKTEQICLQNVSEGVSISQGKTKDMEKLEDSVSHASVGHFEKALHQLKDIDFDNLDPSIDIKSKIQIYGAEIDYLNEKNLFHTYALNALTDPTHFVYNSVFLDNVNESLTTKAKYLTFLENEYKFDPHISNKEKELIAKILESDYTYKKQFDDWLDLQKGIRKTKSNVDHLDDLKKQIEQCRALKSKEISEREKLIEDLRLEREALRFQLVNMNTISEENETLKKQVKFRDDQIGKVDTQESLPSVGRLSKIPLLKGSSIEGIPINSKTTATAPLSNRDQNVQTRTDNPTAIFRTHEQLVTPAEVRLAIAGETSIDNLRRFSNLLAEDNFDLAAEIEKLLRTIEELRRQLKENCEILSETVEMLQSSEIFVNNLEKKLSIETKKTQIISNRVDKLNDLNKQVIVELQRILKKKAPAESDNMDIQDRCNYLLLCLKKLENENKSLEAAYAKLQNEADTSKINTDLNLLTASLTTALDFEFETTLLPNGKIVGEITLVHTDDTKKSLALTFNVNSSKDNRNTSITNEGAKIAHFLIEREKSPPAAASRSENDTLSKSKNIKKDNNFNNNNCCLRNYSFSIPLSTLSYLPTTFSVSTSLPPMKPQSNNSLITNTTKDVVVIKDSDYCYYRSLPDIPLFCQIMERGNSTLEGDDDVTMGTESLSSCTIGSSPDLPENFFNRQYASLSSLSSVTNRKNRFINYRTPIYFRKFGEKP